MSYPQTIHDIIVKNAIFFGPSGTKEQLIKDCTREAKTTLISDILNMRRVRGEQPEGDDFDQLYNYSVDRLHAQIIKEQDKTYK